MEGLPTIRTQSRIRCNTEASNHVVTTARIEYGLLVLSTSFKHSPDFATSSAYSSLVRSLPPGSTIIAISSSFARCGSSVGGTLLALIMIREGRGGPGRGAVRLIL